MKITVTIPKKEVYTLTKQEAVNINMNVTGSRGGGGETVEAFPVGSVFTSVVDTNPAQLLGYGAWQKIAGGRVLVGHEQNDPDFDAALKQGGSKEVAAAGTNSQPLFTGNALGSHSHPGVSAGTPSGSLGFPSSTEFAGTGAKSAAGDRHIHNFTGNALPAHQHPAASAGTPSGTVSAPVFNGSPTSVVQPYLVVFFWQRVE
ncbi:MAG: phage baseplate protein [Bacteroidales bacterium]